MSLKISRFDFGFLEVPDFSTLNIYAVGCLHRCGGCSNKQLQDFNYFDQFDFTDRMLVREVSKAEMLIDGICFLGGDAVFQKEEIWNMSEVFRKNFPEKFICIYTGFTFNELDERTKAAADVIVDGKWIGKPIDDPETNQKIWIRHPDGWKTVEYPRWKEKMNMLMENYPVS